MNILLKTWLTLEIFAVIFVLYHVKIIIACIVTNLPNSTALHAHSVIDCHVFSGTNFSLKAIYFASFYFRVFNSIRKIRENKNLLKISTYTVHTFCNIKP